MAEVSLNTSPGTLLVAGQFFDLVDDVLTGVGRGPLPARGPERRIIRVRPEDKVLQILAGAGSGKTEMLVWRVLYELFVLGTPATEVLVTTFTRKAATELSVRMVERSDAMLAESRARGLNLIDPHVHDLRIGTIHSLCDSLLSEFDSQYMAAGTQVVDEIETRVRLTRELHRKLDSHSGRGVGLVDRILATEPLVALFRAPWLDDGWPRSSFDKVSLLQSLLAQQTETWIPRCAADGKRNGLELVSRDGLTADLISLQERWERYLGEQQILDFATVQKMFLDRQSSVKGHVAHVFVDEFQDTNPVQLAIHLNWLSSASTRLTVVGDDDQALYRFRGSDIDCFTGLDTTCRRSGFHYRLELLENNWRSTRAIVDLCQAFREQSVLRRYTMPKTIRSPRVMPVGEAPRLLQGPWNLVCDAVGAEIEARGAASLSATAVLLFSTSERETRRGTLALDLRRALEGRGLTVYNARNKTAAQKGSPVHSLLALLSYLIDPVTLAPAGAGGREVMVWASCGDAAKAEFSPTAPPTFRVSGGHADIQKAFRGSRAGVAAPRAEIVPLLDYIDKVRERLVRAVEKHARGRGEAPRLTLSGLVARLLTLEFFRDVGFTPDLFREALFTQLLESQIAPTRRTRASLDMPLAPARDGSGKVVWPGAIWGFLNVFGSIVFLSTFDDIEDDAFAENSVTLLTFHQAKGLEFDHVYVGMTGREPSPHSVLQTMLFSGQRVDFELDGDGQPVTSSRKVRGLAAADRDRELYVAMSRAKQTLTFIHDPADMRHSAGLSSTIAELFADAPECQRTDGTVERKWLA